MRPAPALVAAALAAAAVHGGDAPAADPGLELSAVIALVDQGAAGGGVAGKEPAYRMLARRLARESRRGLPDDLGKLRSVAAACAGPLVSDDALRSAFSGSLDDGAAAVRALDAEVLGAAGMLAVERHRGAVLSMASRARALQRDGESRRLFGADAAAAGLFRGAALGFARARRAAERLRARETPRNPAWAVPVQGRAGALLGVWGEAGPDPRIYAVGAGDSMGPQFLVLHPGSEGWVRVPVAASGDLWWVTGVPGAGAWAAGTGGRVVAYDPATGAMEDRSTGADAILYGVWGSGPSDVWAVGGDPLGIGPRPALLHWDGAAWTPVDPPAAAAGRMLYKVWGSAADDVWACGEGGVLLRFDGAAWTSVASGTASVLFTVHGPAPVTAVGGGASAVAVEEGEGGAFSTIPVSGVAGGSGSQIPGPVLALNGVFVPPEGAALAVGFSRSVVRRGANGWTGVAGVPASVRDLHAVWMDGEGNAVMVGGRLSNLTEGQIVTLGRRALPSDVVARSRFLGQVADLLYSSCAHSGCHLPPFSNAQLAMDDPATTHANLVLAPSTQSPLLRVSPGRPSRSYLWHKLLGTHETVGGSGDRMPQFHLPGDDFLTDEEMDLVRGWILDGARDD